MSRRVDTLLVIVFLLIVALPLAANLTGHDGGDEEAENRKLAPKPVFHASWAAIAAYPAGWDSWFQDHFGFRSTLVRWSGELHYFVLNVSPSSAVVKGRNGWLNYADDGGVQDYANSAPLTDPELAMWTNTLERAREWLAARHVAFVFTVAPGKSTIYPEGMPGSIRRLATISRMDQVLEAVRARTHVATVDLVPALASARERAPNPIYFLTDTHWNDRGAVVAYRQIIDAVRQQRPDVPPAWTDEDFEPTSWPVQGQDLAGMMGLKSVLHETEYSLRPRRARRAVVVYPRGAAETEAEGELITEIRGSTLPRAVVFRDSFGSRLVPYLSEHFSRVVYEWQNDFDGDIVTREKADVVIQEIVSRHLYGFLPTPELVPDR